MSTPFALGTSACYLEPLLVVLNLDWVMALQQAPEPNPLLMFLFGHLKPKPLISSLIHWFYRHKSLLLALLLAFMLEKRCSISI